MMHFQSFNSTNSMKRESGHCCFIVRGDRFEPYPIYTHEKSVIDVAEDVCAGFTCDCVPILGWSRASLWVDNLSLTRGWLHAHISGSNVNTTFDLQEKLQGCIFLLDWVGRLVTKQVRVLRQVPFLRRFQLVDVEANERQGK